MYGLKIYCMMQVMIMFRILDLKFQKIQKWPEIHETEHGHVIWHMYSYVIFFLQFETSYLWEVAQMKSQGILEQTPVTLRRTLSLLKPWAFTCRHESRFSSAGAVRASVWVDGRRASRPLRRLTGRRTSRPLRRLIGRWALWPGSAAHLRPNCSHF